MNATLLSIFAITALLFGSLASPPAFAQFQSGGVPKEGTWHAGEGLKHGDFFSYSMCHVDYKECTNFELDMWIKGDKQVGTETKWLAEVVVFDGSKIVVGEIELGKIAPEPTGGSSELGLYRGAFKSSVVWLSAFATSDGSSGGKGPKAFSATSWGKIGNIGGEQVVPMAIETIVVPSGSWDTVQVGWKTGGVTSKVWIVDDFPFPVKAKTYTHVSEGIPPTEYEFQLLDYKENVQESPIAQYTSTEDQFIDAGCDTDFDKEVSVKKPTNNFDYQIHVFYGPEDLVQGCETQWLIKFISKFDDTEFLNQVQYDFIAVDDDFNPIRSLAQEDNKNFLYSPSGQAILDFIVKEEPGTARYVVLVYGLAPESIVPATASDYLEISANILANDNFVAIKDETKIIEPTEIVNDDSVDVSKVIVTPKATATIPPWIKTVSSFWVDGISTDDEFIGAIQFLIEKGVIQIPSASDGSGDDTAATTAAASEIPPWIKNNVSFWVDGISTDDEFIGAIQFLIGEGILRV